MKRTQNVYDARFRQNKAFIEGEMYHTAFKHGIISNVLVLVGTDFKRHVQQAFKFVARPYQGEQKAKVIIVENDSNLDGTYQFLLDQRNAFPPEHLFRCKVEIHNTDVMNIQRSFRFEDMDLCATPKETWYVLKERLRRQAQVYNNPEYLKAFIFTWCERGYGRQNSFKFLREMCSILDSKLRGMNGARGKWYLLERAKRLGKYKPKNINTMPGTGSWAYENTPNFDKRGRIVACRVFNYNGLSNKGKKTSPMVTGIIVYT